MQESTFAYESVLSCIKNAYEQYIREPWNPECFLADGAASITAAYKTVFDTSLTKRTMCNIHAFRNIDAQIKTLDDKMLQAEIKNDIHSNLLNAPSEELFDTIFPLYIAKWLGFENETVNRFVEYLDNAYNGELQFWFHAAAPSYVTSTNGLESLNHQFKQQYTGHKRLSMHEFLTAVLNTITIYSEMRKEFKFTPDWNEAEFLQNAYSYLRTNPQLVPLTDCYLIRGSENENPESAPLFLRLYENPDFESAGEYEWFRDAFHVVTIRDNTFVCTCQPFLFAKRCKHILLIRSKFEGYQFPEKAKVNENMPLAKFTKNPAYRPPKVATQHNRKRKAQ